MPFRAHYGRKVTKSPDGKIWFSAPDGVSVIDPRHLPFNKLPPPVHIEQITADGKTYWQDCHGECIARRLPPRVRDLTIDYTALSLVVPEKVHFRFKLEGQDRDWREVVNERQVQYSNLRRGKYRFRVTACNNSGVWNEAGTFLDFSIAPAYYQTSWFRGLCVVAFLAMLWGLYQFRLRQLAREFEMSLEARVSERTRIARELHDTLLQSFQRTFAPLSDGFEPAGAGRCQRKARQCDRSGGSSDHRGARCRAGAAFSNGRDERSCSGHKNRRRRTRVRRDQGKILLRSACKWKEHRETCVRYFETKSTGLRARRCAMRSSTHGRTRLKWKSAMTNASFGCASVMTARESTRTFLVEMGARDTSAYTACANAPNSWVVI